MLGEANDCYLATRRLDRLLDAVRQTQPGLWDLVRGGIEEFRAHAAQRLREQRWAFTDWWRRWQALRPEAIVAGVTPPAKSAAAGSSAPAPAGP
jgi:hypothetical protein